MDTATSHAEYTETTDAGYACTKSKHANAANGWMAGNSGGSARTAFSAHAVDSSCFNNSARCSTPARSAEPRVAGWMVWFFTSLQ